MNRSRKWAAFAAIGNSESSLAELAAERGLSGEAAEVWRVAVLAEWVDSFSRIKEAAKTDAALAARITDLDSLLMNGPQDAAEVAELSQLIGIENLRGMERAIRVPASLDASSVAEWKREIADRYSLQAA